MDWRENRPVSTIFEIFTLYADDILGISVAEKLYAKMGLSMQYFICGFCRKEQWWPDDRPGRFLSSYHTRQRCPAPGG
jgi:hypothetical protein